ncbi:hypothetical protein KUCAC02_011097, partial [Chaenocephalus aceratus]
MLETLFAPPHTDGRSCWDISTSHPQTWMLTQGWSSTEDLQPVPAWSSLRHICNHTNLDAASKAGVLLRIYESQRGVHYAEHQVPKELQENQVKRCTEERKSAAMSTWFLKMLETLFAPPHTDGRSCWDISTSHPQTWMLTQGWSSTEDLQPVPAWSSLRHICNHANLDAASKAGVLLR